MKWLKKIVLISLISLGAINSVEAGTISFNNAVKISDTKYRFTLTIDDIDLNYLSGKVNITNGTLTKVIMANQWMNETGNNNTFYFYRNGLGNEEPLVATFEVTMTGNSTYSLADLKYGMNKCQKDNYGNYFGPTGNLIDGTSYQTACTKSSDATLKSLTTKAGTLSPSFKSTNYTYSLEVNKNATAVVFYSTPTSDKAKVKSETACLLKNEVTACEIVVKAESGATNTYVINVSKTKEDENSFIKNFKVHNGVLNQTFDIDTTSYKITPDKNAENIYFTFELNGETYTSKECSAKASTCTLSVSSMDKKRTYSFMIENEDEEKINAEPDTDSSNNNPETNSQNQNNNNNNNNNTNNGNNYNSNSSNKNNSSNSNKEIEDKVEDSIKDETDEEETIDPIEQNKDSKNEENEEVKEIQPIKKESKEEDKNNFLIILCVVNILLGVIIGFFIKKRIYR